MTNALAPLPVTRIAQSLGVLDVRNLVGFYGAGELGEFEKFGNVRRVLDAFVKRPAVERGLAIPPRG
jgi:hypothetical protein